MTQDEQQAPHELKRPELDFGSTFSSNLPAILSLLNISLAVTSYQSQRLILIQAKGDTVETKLKAFSRPMGLYADARRLTIGTLNQVIDFQYAAASLQKVKQGGLDKLTELPAKLQDSDWQVNTEILAERQQQLDDLKAADALLLERAALTTGMINIHDIAWGKQGLWVVNSTFSCLSRLSPNYSFIACWKPPFINDLVPEDRCHLNGMAMLDGEPRYVTTFNQSDRRDSWRLKGQQAVGTLIDIKQNRILKDDLLLPHSPRCHNGWVYYCVSGHGEVQRYHPETEVTELVCQLPGFTRGMAFIGDLMLVATSKVRPSQLHDNQSAPPMPLQQRLGDTESICGVWLVDTKTGDVIASLQFEGDVTQLYDIAVLHGAPNVELLQHTDVLASHLFEFSQE
jgi:uncharacterized protein (TIGR03032 family)